MSAVKEIADLIDDLDLTHGAENTDKVLARAVRVLTHDEFTKSAADDSLALAHQLVGWLSSELESEPIGSPS